MNTALTHDSVMVVTAMFLAAATSNDPRGPGVLVVDSRALAPGLAPTVLATQSEFD